MTIPVHGPMLLVVNPRAGTGRGGVLDEVRRVLETGGVHHRLAITTGAGDATTIARRAVEQDGVRFVVAVGGDGTVNEVVNGLVDVDSGDPVAADLVLGVVPGGSGSDLVRTWGLDLPVERLVTRHLLTEAVLPLDLGRATFVGPDGREQRRLFANVAQCGWGADVVRLANRLPRRTGRARYLAATLVSTARMDSVPTTVTMDHATHEEELTEVVVANGQFFGSGMKIAPRALPDDGRFNVQTWRVGPRELLEQLPAARVGEHLSTPFTREWQSATVTVDAATPMTVEADGEPLGTTPARFEVLERVLSLSA